MGHDPGGGSVALWWIRLCLVIGLLALVRWAWSRGAETWMNVRAIRAVEVLLTQPAAWFTVARLVAECPTTSLTLVTGQPEMRLSTVFWYGAACRTPASRDPASEFQLVWGNGSRLARGWFLLSDKRWLAEWQRAFSRGVAPPRLQELLQRFQAHGGTVVS